MRRLLAMTLLGVIATTFPSGSAAQWRTDPAWRVDDPQTVLEPVTSPAAPTLLSLALPGAGQHVLGQKRKWVYLAVEVAGWALWAERRHSARDYRDRYRDYAWEAARLQSAPRVDGDFEYYERMTKWSRSGAFDADPSSAGVQPEPDVGTYNGSVWALATQIHFAPGSSPSPTDPAYQSALAYYDQRAYGSALLWDWTGAPEGRQELARLIEESDSRFGQATTALGAVIANHVLSAADAYLSARSRAAARLRVVPVGPGALPAVAPRLPGVDWMLVLSVAVGR